MNRDAFLLERMKGIGGADAAAALGFDPYKTRYELWAQKTGELADDFEDTRYTRAGRVLEAAIADLYAEQFGVTLRKRMVPVVHPKYPWMRGNLDRTIVGARSVLEIKNVDGMVHRTSGEWGEEGSDQIPIRYMIQVRHYLIITGFDVGYLGALVGGNDLKRYVVERDKEAEEYLVEGEHAFWQLVEKREPPEFDFEHASTLGLLKRLHPGSNGLSKPLSLEAFEWHQQIQAANEEMKRLEKLKDEGRAHILKELDGYAFGTFTLGGEYRYREIERPAYEVKAGKYQDLRFCKNQTAFNAKRGA
jgi:putative phage-type endonuclease